MGTEMERGCSGVAAAPARAEWRARLACRSTPPPEETNASSDLPPRRLGAGRAGGRAALAGNAPAMCPERREEVAGVLNRALIHGRKRRRSGWAPKNGK